MAYKETANKEGTPTEAPAPEVKTSVAAPAVNTKPSVPNEKEIKIKLKNPTKIDFIICNTGERNTRMVHESKFILTKNILFKIPLEDSSINYSDFNIIKLKQPYTEHFRILDIVNGIATIEPILHGAFVEDGMVLGVVY